MGVTGTLKGGQVATVSPGDTVTGYSVIGTLVTGVVIRVYPAPKTCLTVDGVGMVPGGEARDTWIVDLDQVFYHQPAITRMGQPAH